MKYRGHVIKLNLKKAIILEDARRICNRTATINNIFRLSEELTDRFTIGYDKEQVYKMLRRSMSVGCSTHGHSNDINVLIKPLCDVLNVKEKDLVIHITN